MVTPQLSMHSLDSKILLLRGYKIMLSSDLADLYQVAPKVLIQAVKRHVNRFPDDFMFQLSLGELQILKSQFVTSSWGGLRKPPYAFTEQGIAMLSSVLNSERAILVNIEVMRTFVKLRQMLATHKELAHKLEALERTYNSQFKMVFDAIRQIMSSPVSNKRPIGIKSKE